VTHSALPSIKEVQVVRRAVPSLPEPLHDNSLVHRVLAARGVKHSDELALSLKQLPRPDSLPNIEQAVQRLLEARNNGQRVLIVGDYDCDGATSTVVAMLGLKMLGFTSLDFFIPERINYGYGLSPAIVDLARDEFQAQLIVTVDNGVASVAGVAHAAANNIDVVVTDHHLAPDVLPDAVAIVNPNLPDGQFPGQNLAGVGVIFYTLLAIRSHLKHLEDTHCNAPLHELLDLVAIGTVADVVPLDALNRTLVENGLRRIRGDRTRPGVKALLHVAGKGFETINTQDIGFGIGPRLNAAGRIADMRVGVQCLLSESDDNARALADRLNAFNRERQNIEAQMRESALEQLDALTLDDGAVSTAFGLCLKDEQWHQGVIGILAGRLKEKTFKPVVVFTADSDGVLKGSARSIPGVHIRDVLQNIATRHPDCISQFGGHAMAAGLSLDATQFDLFRVAFDDAVKQTLKGHQSVRRFLSDGPLEPSERTLENAQLLVNIMPWGQMFEAPVFDNALRIHSQKILKQAHLKLVLECPLSGQKMDAIAFNQQPVANDGEMVNVVYALDVNFYRDAYTLQLRIEHLEAVALR